MDATYFGFSSMELDVFHHENDPTMSGYPHSPENSPLFDSPDAHFFDEDEAAVMGLKLSYHSCGSPASANSCSSDDMPVTPLSSGAESELFYQQRDELETGQTVFINTSDMYSELLDQLEQSGSSGMLESETSMQRKQTSACGAVVNPADIQASKKVKSSPGPTDGEQSPTDQNGAINALPVKSTSRPSARPTVLGDAPSSSSKVRQDRNNLSLVINNGVAKVGVKRNAAQEKVEAKKAKKGCRDSTPISRNEKNAIAARENRLKKKVEFEELKRREFLLEEENKSLHKANSDHVKTIKGLEQELEYYKSVLFNQSSLATILHKISPQKLELSSSVGVSAQEETVGVQKLMSGGVCLHVNGTDASLEWCSKCSMNAQNSFRS